MFQRTDGLGRLHAPLVALFVIVNSFSHVTQGSFTPKYCSPDTIFFFAHFQSLSPLSTTNWHVPSIPAGSDGTESACSVEDQGSIPGLGSSPGGVHGNPLQYSCLENAHGQRSLASCSPRDWKESDMT